MSQFTWDNKYSVGNEELDDHHKKLFTLFNNLYESCLDKTSRITLGPIVDELVSYFNYHLAAEEQYMRSIGYKDIDKHIAEHKIFLDSISKQQQKLNINDTVVTNDFIVYLGKWLTEHVMIEDKKYSLKACKGRT